MLLRIDPLTPSFLYRPDDDGSFQRRTRRDDGPDREMSRADQDSSWRKGSGGGGFRDDRGGGGGFGDRGGFDRGGGGGGYRDDRRGGGGGGGGFDRGGYRGGGSDRGNDRGGYDRDGGGGGSRFDRRGGPFDRDGGAGAGAGGSRFDRGGDRGGGFDRRGPRDGDVESSGPGPAGERPRLQLKARTATKSESASKETSQVTAPTPVERKEIPLKKEATTTSPPDGPKKDESEPSLIEEKIDVGEKEAKPDEAEKKRREPAVVNSRAAMLGEAPDVRRDVSSNIGEPPFFTFFDHSNTNHIAGQQSSRQGREWR